MFAIGERINGMFKRVGKAIASRDKGPVQKIAVEQIDAGANALDLNVGPVRGNATENMLWLIETVQEVTDVPLCIDTPKAEVMKMAVEACKNPVIINSSKAVEKQLEEYVELANKKDASLVALTINESGVPKDVDGRVQMGATIVTKAMEGGLEMQRLFIDPVILPVNVAPKQPRYLLEAIRQMRMLTDPAPNFIIGLSNVSQNCRERSLLDRSYIAMAICAGLNAAIMNVLDDELMKSAITAEVLMEKHLYCDDYVSAYLSSK